mgnify:CR=1 FL=1
MKQKRFIFVFFMLCLVAAGLTAQKQKPEMVVQTGHTKGVTAVAWSHDNRYVLSGSSDGKVILWDVYKGKELRTLSGHSKTISSLSFLKTDKYAVSASHDNTIRLWDVATGKEMWKSTGHTSRINSVSISPCSTYILSGGGFFGDSTIKLWDVESGRELATFKGHGGSVKSVSFSPDGKSFISGSTDKTIRKWDLDTGLELWKAISQYSVNAVDYSPNGEYLASAEYLTIKLYNAHTGKEVRSFLGHKNFITKVLFSPDGEYIVSSSEDATVKVWNVRTGALLNTLTGHYGKVNDLAFSTDGLYIVSGSADVSIILWDIERGELLAEYFGISEGQHCADVFVTGKKALSVSGKRLATNLIHEWNLQKVKLISTIASHGDLVTKIAYHLDSNICISCSLDNSIAEWDLLTRNYVNAVYGGPSGVESITFSENGELGLSGSWDKSLMLWDIETGKEIWKIPDAHQGYVTAVSISADNKYAISGSGAGDETVKIWDVTSGTIVHSFAGHSGSIYSVAISSDNRYAISGSSDKTIILWDLHHGQLKKKFLGHNDSVTCVSFSADNKFILSGSADTAIKIWDIETGENSRTLTGHSDTVNSVSFHGGREFVISTSNDGTMRIWNTETNEWVAFIAGSSNLDQWFIYDSDGNWDTSSKGGELVAMVRGMEPWNIDQFAARNNRPDLILEKLPNADPELIDHYYSQYRRRLRRLGLTEADLGDNYHVPETEILDTRQYGKNLTLNLSFSDSREKLKSYNIYINDVPLFGAYGKKLRGSTRKLSETVELSSGENKIEVSCMNNTGTESFRAVTYAEYDNRVEKNLYFIGFGVSEYQDSALNLRYADKDVQDLASTFSRAGNQFTDVIIKTYTNEQVTRRNVQGVKNILQKASVDDTVVLFISGHGVHDHDEYATYYFLSHEADLDNLSQTAIDFEQLEDLLQGIPPRNKLFLMDTCGSGELEPEDIRHVAMIDKDSKGVWSRLPAFERGVAVQTQRDQAAGTGARTYLQDKDRYIYNDLLRRSGAIVFSSCRGDEVSYESREYENGLFTEYIIRALIGEGDEDGNGVVSTEELRQFVENGVSAETEGDPLLYAIPQHPTVDRDNIYVEF